ncbi:four helix bundle protein [Flavobacterium sp.]|uniref:four helix bundle protein n=1 Tax=Flavobacterium sp. TaxID=239 RepID=UPI003753022B
MYDKRRIKITNKEIFFDDNRFGRKTPKLSIRKSCSNQIIRSATSVGANYRAVCRARSDKEFVAKMNIVLEEAD